MTMDVRELAHMTQRKRAELQQKLDTTPNGKGFRCRMPEGFTPREALVAMKKMPNGYAIRVMGEAHYEGTNASLQQLAQGIKVFPTFEELRQFLREIDPQPVDTGLRDPFPPVDTTPNITRAPRQPRRRAGEVTTDIDQVQVQDPRPKPQYVDPEQLYAKVSEQIRGQDEALPEICRQVAAHAAKVEPARPLTLLVCGPAGCGKTQTAKGLADSLNALGLRQAYGTVVIHCNELSEANHVNKLLGAPAGYVGYGDELVLNPVATNPCQIVVFDEIEKAHPQVLKVIMSAMDSGFMMLNKAPEGGSLKLDMRRCVLFFTSNLPLERGLEPGASLMERDRHFRTALRREGILPEIVDRFYCITTYKALGGRAMVEIVTQGIGRTASQYGLRLTYVTPAIVQAIYDMVGGSSSARIIGTLVDRYLGVFFAHQAQGEARDTLYRLEGTLEAPTLVVDEEAMAELPASEPTRETGPASPDDLTRWCGDLPGPDDRLPPEPFSQDPETPVDPVNVTPIDDDLDTPPSRVPDNDNDDPDDFWQRFM